jgi:hypothetical protein
MDAVIFWIVMYFGTGFLVGVIGGAVSIWEKWRQGDDVLLSDIIDLVGALMVCLFVWPAVIWMVIVDVTKSKFKLNKNSVVLKGSRSAKTHRALMED